MTLGDLRPGERGTITNILGGGTPLRLMEMGLLPGTAVEVLRLAPLGDPMDVRVRGYRLSLRKAEARLIMIKRHHP